MEIRKRKLDRVECPKIVHEYKGRIEVNGVHPLVADFMNGQRTALERRNHLDSNRFGHSPTELGNHRNPKCRLNNPKLSLLVTDDGRFGRHTLLSKARTLSVGNRSGGFERFCATWPQSNMPVSSLEDFLAEGEAGGGHRSRNEDEDHSPNVRDVIKEWCIPFKDIEFTDLLKHTPHADIYRGHWHGDVLICAFHNYTEKERVAFLEEIAQWCMIRHENIMLFMGASIESPHLAVITCSRKGPSIYEYVHQKQQTLSLTNKIQIARQVAQAMGYLHARGIIHKRLTSFNVILESKVKICLLDQAMMKPFRCVDHQCVLPKGFLTYFCPELIRSISVESSEIKIRRDYTQESDVYSFGTLLYELLVGHYPFNGVNCQTIIWLIGSGCHQKVNNIKCSNTMKAIIAYCWTAVANQRPEFSYIVKQLQQNVSLHKKHSSSEPERLHQSGLQLATNRTFCS